MEINEELINQVIVPLVITIAGAGYSALAGTKLFSRLQDWRETKIMRYVEVGVRAAYQSHVRHWKSTQGKLSPQQANMARQQALKAAGEEAVRNGDRKLVEKLSREDLTARLELVLQEIKSSAGAGALAKVSDRPRSTPPGIGSNSMLAIMGILGLSGLFFSGCITPGATQGPALNKYDAEARMVWNVWQESGTAGQLPSRYVPGQTTEDAREEAVRYTTAVLLYAITADQSTTPRPSPGQSLREAVSVTNFYINRSWAHAGFTLPEIYKEVRDRVNLPEPLKEILDSYMDT